LAIYTDVPDYAGTLLPADAAPRFARSVGAPDVELDGLLQAFFGTSPQIHSAALHDPLWRQLLVSGYSDGSQYERLIRLGRSGLALPHGLACVARTGSGLQGFRGRSWVASPGNIHLTVHLAPGRAIERFETVFTALAAVSVADAIDEVAGLEGRARIRWVNDVVIDGAKVGGVLAYTQTRGMTVTSVVLGIGVNVEATPVVRPTPFVPAAAALRDFSGDPAPRLGEVLWSLLRALERNYRRLLADGFQPIVERYRARAAVLGEEVFISFDEPDERPRLLAAGRVSEIGDGLELYLDGWPEPVTRGRLIMGDAAEAALARARADVREILHQPAI
jgi:biotin-[acetyl-CoA-carboxylase] ligase BirA-like protein